MDRLLGAHFEPERVAQGNGAGQLRAYAGPLTPDFIASLPPAAVNGTMKNRMNGESIAGEAHVKTGSLADLRAIAGYVLGRERRLQVAVMIVNDPKASAAGCAAALGPRSAWRLTAVKSASHPSVRFQLGI
ncbi:MAG TPA: D-alanyl-D-alanine carboxypeptidase [Burkholderiales bacterium]|nr:D-alanyl-D-alanine carboxypeptidase [Burkholderiales bacterium]